MVLECLPHGMVDVFDTLLLSLIGLAAELREETAIDAWMLPLMFSQQFSRHNFLAIDSSNCLII
jgi:hypothetical protein